VLPRSLWTMWFTYGGGILKEKQIPLPTCYPNRTLLPLKVLMPWALGFFTYSSIKEHFTSIVCLEGNRSYNCQSLQLRNNGFWVWGGLAIANPSKISLSQLWTMNTFHMARALLIETMLYKTTTFRNFRG
jgi:hypothetical protein